LLCRLFFIEDLEEGRLLNNEIKLSETLLGELNLLLSSIICDSSVRSVILFDSTALGTRNEHSDIDLLVLVDDNELENSVIAARIRMEAFNKISFPLDLIVEKLSDYKNRVTLPTLERKIAREGKVLYAA
jgi:predicted nucleotidyltransferase